MTDLPVPYYAVAKNRYSGPAYHVVEVVSATAKSHTTRTQDREGQWGRPYRTMRRANYPASFASYTDAGMAADRANEVWARHTPAVDAAETTVTDLVRARLAAALAAMGADQ